MPDDKAGWLAALLAQQHEGGLTAAGRPAASWLTRTSMVADDLTRELDLGKFVGPLIRDAKPRLLLHFQVNEGSPVKHLGDEIVLKVYPDRARGEGPLLAAWREAGLNTPKLAFGTRDGCSWIAIEYLRLTPVTLDTSTSKLNFTDSLAAMGEVMHRPISRLTSTLRPLIDVMLPRWDESADAVRASGYDVPSQWRLQAADCYSIGHPRPLHGDLALQNLALDAIGTPLIYDASALIGAPAFDCVRWSVRLSDSSIGPEELIERWATTEVIGRAFPGLLAAECILEAGSRLTVNNSHRLDGSFPFDHDGIESLIHLASRRLDHGP